MSPENLNLFRTLFLQAVNNVGPAYMRTIYGEMDMILQFVEHEAQRQHIEKHMIGDNLVKTGERIFCYELYHQLRLLMDRHPEQFAGVYLQGELRKYQVLPMLDQMGLVALSSNFMPDFLLHTPGNADDHPYVVEVKTDRFLRCEHLAADISKLVEFITRYGYQRGIFLSVNISSADLRRTLTECTLLRNLPRIGEVAGQIDIIGRENENTPATFFNFGELIQ
jgi:hypothetical protein